MFNLLLILAILILSLGHLMIGNTRYSIQTMFQVLAGQQVPGATFTFRHIRFPRLSAGILAGFSFGLAGSTFQSLLKNPLASPDILGVTTSSSAAAVFCILVLKTSRFFVSTSAVIAGLAVSGILYCLANVRGFTIGKMILLGIGFNALGSAIISYLLVVSNQYDLAVAMRWLSGSLNGLQFQDVLGLTLALVLFVPMLMLLGKQLQILELGDTIALGLGVKTTVVRIIIMISSVILVSFATALTGPIGFVAFISGPITKLLIGKNHSTILSSGLVGVCLVLVADLLGQYAFQTRYPVGIITGLVGAPYLLFLLIFQYKAGEVS
jgi:iron complex transport system permease protein